jgi:aminoglycoside phosphotransferase (APT) family kinase protein
MSGTTGIRGGSELDIAALGTYLANLEDVPWIKHVKLMTVVQFQFGQSNPTYLLSFQTGLQLVLRRKPTGVTIKSAHAVDREYTVLRALHAAGYPVPRPIVLEHTGSALGSPFYIMEFVAGGVCTDPTLAVLPPESKSQVYLEAVSLLARLHGMDVHSLKLDGFGPIGGHYFERQMKRLVAVSLTQANHAPALARITDALTWFQSNLPADEVRLIHGDYKLDNLIFSEPLPMHTLPHPWSETFPAVRVNAVLDWEMSTLGHPLADVANLCAMYWTPSTGSWNGLLGVDVGLSTTGKPSIAWSFQASLPAPTHAVQAFQEKMSC